MELPGAGAFFPPMPNLYHLTFGNNKSDGAQAPGTINQDAALAFLQGSFSISKLISRSLWLCGATISCAGWDVLAKALCDNSSLVQAIQNSNHLPCEMITEIGTTPDNIEEIMECHGTILDKND